MKFNKYNYLLVAFSLLLSFNNFAFADDCANSSLSINGNASVSTVNSNATFRVTENFSEPVKSFSADAVIVDGGTVKEVRKLSKTSYVIIITPNSDASQVSTQIEADKVKNACGVTNDDASNEVVVNVKQVAPAATSNSTDSQSAATTLNLSDLLNQILGPSQQVTSPVQNTSVAPTQQVQTYLCNGQQIPVTQTCNTQQAIAPYQQAPLSPYQQQCQMVYDYYSGTYQQQCAYPNTYSTGYSPYYYQSYQQTNPLSQILGNWFGSGSSNSYGGYSGGNSGYSSQSQINAAQDAQQDASTYYYNDGSSFQSNSDQ